MQAIVMIIALTVVLGIGTVAAGGFGAVIENANNIPGFFELFGIATPVVGENGIQLIENGKPVFGEAGAYGIITVLSTLSWGLGYFGMPHIIIRFMSLRSDKDVKKSAKIGITWTVLILVFSVAAGIIGHLFLGEIQDSSVVFITMVRKIFPALISGLLLSAILAAAMSTADSQLLASASAFSVDVYKPIFRKNKASEKEMLWAGRLVVLAISVIAVLIASNPNSGTIMSLVENAWGVFGAAFGPVIMLSLFWRRFNFQGAVAGILSGAAVDILWLVFLKDLGIYEIIPGFIVSTIVAIVVALLTKAPEKEVTEIFDKVASGESID
jgi:sodium/proline symporter